MNGILFNIFIELGEDMKVRIVFYRNKYWPQWKGSFRWRAFWYVKSSEIVAFSTEKEAEDYLKKKTWETKPPRIIKTFEV